MGGKCDLTHCGSIGGGGVTGAGSSERRRGCLGFVSGECREGARPWMDVGSRVGPRGEL
jgi:hypothetical protein